MLRIATVTAAATLCLAVGPINLQAQLTIEDRIRKISIHYAGQYGQLYGVPRELVEAVIEVESGWRPDALSPRGVAGLMQLMPRTARRFGVGNCYNIEQNIRGGTEYLAWLNSLFKGDLRLVVATYLAGEARVLPKGLAYASPEVFSYVSQVASLYRQKNQLSREKEKRSKE